MGVLCRLRGAAFCSWERSRLLLWGTFSLPSSFPFPFSTPPAVFASPPYSPGIRFLARVVTRVAFAVDPFGFGIQVDLAPAPEFQGGFLLVLCLCLVCWVLLCWGGVDWVGVCSCDMCWGLVLSLACFLGCVCWYQVSFFHVCIPACLFGLSSLCCVPVCLAPVGYRHLPHLA